MRRNAEFKTYKCLQCVLVKHSTDTKWITTVGYMVRMIRCTTRSVVMWVKIQCVLTVCDVKPYGVIYSKL